MKAGDLIYQLDDLEELAPSRGDLVALLADCVNSVTVDNDRLSNGDVADALLGALDMIVTTDEQWASLKAVIDEYRT